MFVKKKHTHLMCALDIISQKPPCSLPCAILKPSFVGFQSPSVSYAPPPIQYSYYRCWVCFKRSRRLSPSPKLAPNPQKIQPVLSNPVALSVQDVFRLRPNLPQIPKKYSRSFLIPLCIVFVPILIVYYCKHAHTHTPNVYIRYFL